MGAEFNSLMYEGSLSKAEGSSALSRRLDTTRPCENSSGEKCFVM